MRVTYLLLIVPAIAFCADREEELLAALASQTSERIQVELAISAEDAASLIAVAREYRAQSQALDEALHQAVFDRRMARMAGEGEGKATEAELVEARERLSDQITSGQMQDLKARMGEAKFGLVRNYMEARKDEPFFTPPAPSVKGTVREGTKGKSKATATRPALLPPAPPAPVR